MGDARLSRNTFLRGWSKPVAAGYSIVFRLGLATVSCYSKFMSGSADAWRRWFGLLFLTVAGGMLIWGQTVLRPHLDGNAFLFLAYWFVCFVLTLAAIAVALLDIRITRLRARQEREQLLRHTMDDLEGELKETRKKRDS